jgi:hypothetical protein
MMKIAELLRALEQATQQGALGTGADASSIRAFALMLADYPDLDVEEFCKRARGGLEKPAKAKKTTRGAPAKAARPAASPALNEAVVARYAGELEQTKADSRQFEKVVERLKKDKEVRIAEAREIARRFLGAARSYKTKPEAAKAILQRQITDIRAEGKAERIADIF